MSNDKHKILGVRDLTNSTYVLEIERRNLKFEAGQHILLGKAGSIHHREYSIYSGVNDDLLEVLIKEVEEGMVSKNLKKLKIGDEVEIQGPLGFFTIEDDFLKNANRFLFLASGTGISPFHSMIKSLPTMNYRVIHGIRYAEEAYEMSHYAPKRYVACTSRDEKGDFHGRLTDYLKQNTIEPHTHCYLCGNFEMIRDAMNLLEEKGIPQDHLHAEVYF